MLLELVLLMTQNKFILVLKMEQLKYLICLLIKNNQGFLLIKTLSIQ